MYLRTPLIPDRTLFEQTKENFSDLYIWGFWIYLFRNIQPYAQFQIILKERVKG